jgi:hypothetical protein
MIRFIGLFDTVRDYILQFYVTHTHTHTPTHPHTYPPTHPHPHQCPQSRIHYRCLVAAANGGCSPRVVLVIGLAFLPRGSVLSVITLQLLPLLLPSVPRSSSFLRAVLWNLFFCFGGGRLVHNVQSLTFRSPVADPTIRFSISSSTVFLKILLDVFSSALYSTVAFRVLPFSLLDCRSLRHAGTARLVNRLRPVANFFRNPLSPWVHFFGCRLRPSARCRSPYRCFSAPIVSTAASSLGIF